MSDAGAGSGDSSSSGNAAVEDGSGSEDEAGGSRASSRVAGALATIREVGSNGDDLPETVDSASIDGELTLYPESHREEPEIDHPVRDQVIEDVKETFDTELESLYYDERPTDEEIERQFFDFSYLHGHEEVERHWVDRPFAYVTVVHDETEDELRYRVVEPVLSEFEQYVLDEFTKTLRNSLMYQDIDSEEEKAAMFSRRARELIEEHTAAIQTVSIHKLLYYLVRDFIQLGKIQPIMGDPNIEDISCDGIDVPIFVYHRRHRDLDSNVRFGEQELSSFVVRLAQRAGKHLSVSNPLVDASLPEGSRIQLTLGGDVATRGPNFTIRQFSSVPDTPVDLLNWNTFSVEELAYLWLAIENNRSLMFAGGTGSGKTTSLNAVSFFIPGKSKVVSIEDTREISLPHDNWIQSITREGVTAGGQGEVSMYQHLQTALRQRPEYLLVGEIRTEQRVALTFFQAMATGHTAYTTVHSDSVRSVVNRLENEPLNVPTQMIQELDIVSIQKQVMMGEDRVRRNARLAELSGNEASDIRVRDIFEWDADTDSFENMRGNSEVMQSIAEDRGWNQTRLNTELQRRERVLQYMVDEEITWWEDVARTIQAFIKNQEKVMQRIEEGALDPEALDTRVNRGTPEVPGEHSQ